MKPAFLLASIIATSSILEARPNILLINVDDLGWADLGFNGSTYYETPNIDKLAKQSMNFTNGYAAAANCAPSRACMLTGQWTPRHGVYTVLNSDRGKANTRKIIPTKNTLFIKDNNLTLGGMLQSAGYKTGTIGKWHITKNPLNNGFDINIGGSKAGGPYNGGKYHSPYSYPNLVETKKGRYLTDHVTDEAIKFVTDNKNKPFFLYLPFFTVHTPIMGPTMKEAYFKRKTPDPKKGQVNPRYAAMISSLDDNIGRLLESLDQQKLTDNTLVVFTSDNGGVWRISKQWPLRAGKGSYYEGGIREPFLIRWPNKIKAGTSNTPVTSLDLFPTLAAVAEATIPKNKIYDGVNLLPFLTEAKQLKQRDLYWHFPIYLQGGNKDCQDTQFRTRPGSAIRRGDYKLIQYFENNDIELYNLKTDPGERNNLATQELAKVTDLIQRLDGWRKRTNAPVPNRMNPNYGQSQLRKKKSNVIK